MVFTGDLNCADDSLTHLRGSLPLRPTLPMVKMPAWPSYPLRTSAMSRTRQSTSGAPTPMTGPSVLTIHSTAHEDRIKEEEYPSSLNSSTLYITTPQHYFTIP